MLANSENDDRNDTDAKKRQSTAHCERVDGTRLVDVEQTGCRTVWQTRPAKNAADRRCRQEGKQKNIAGSDRMLRDDQKNIPDAKDDGVGGVGGAVNRVDGNFGCDFFLLRGEKMGEKKSLQRVDRKRVRTPHCDCKKQTGCLGCEDR